MLTKLWQEYTSFEKFLSFCLLGVLLLAVFAGFVRIIWGAPEEKLADDVYAEAIVSNFSMINPLFADLGNNANRELSRLIYAGLTQYNPAEKHFEPGLATYTINDQVNEYTFKLKKDLEWHDGKKITTEDVLFTYNEVIKHPDFTNSFLKERFENVDVVLVDDETVKFVLPKPNAFFLADVMVGILPKHIYQNVPVSSLGTQFVPELLVGSGPFVFEEFEIDESQVAKVQLSAFKDYYLGKPKIKNFDYYVVPSDDLLLALRNKVRAIPRFNRDIEESFEPAFKVQSYRLPQYTALFLNQDTPVLKEERMRKVLNRLIDKNLLATELPTKQVVDGPYFVIEPEIKFADRQYTPLREALFGYGWKLQGDGYRYNELGEPLKFILLREIYADFKKQEESDKLVTHFVDAAKEVGMQIDVINADAADFAARLENKAYDILLAGHDFGYSLDSFGFWHSSVAKPNTFNFSNYRSPTADAIMVAARSLSDHAQRIEKLKELNALLKAESPAIFLYTQQYAFAFDNSVKNRTILGDYATITDRFYDIQLWELR